MSSPSTSTDTNKKVTLRSSDGEEFVVDEKAAMLSQTIKNMIEDDCVSGTIPISNVDAELLTEVLSYCNKHAEEDVDKDALKAFDKELVDRLPQPFLFDLIMAANYLDVAGLMDILCWKAADIIKGMNDIKEVHKLLNIVSDFTPEEEEEIRIETPWVWE